MKQPSAIFLGFLCLGLFSCNDDEVTPITILVADTVGPEIKILSPQANDSILVVDVVEIQANVRDDKRLEHVQLVLEAPDGGRQILADVTISPYDNFKNYRISEFYRIPKHTALGNYFIMVEAKDMALNTTKSIVTFKFHASDLNYAAFLKPFSNAFVNSTYFESLDWFGYNFEHGFAFDDVWLSILLNLMISSDNDYSISEAEWMKFINDFGFKNQDWMNWDQDNDGNLNDKEFYEGLKSLNIFVDWDKNKDNLVNKEELAAGIFERWDDNQDGILNKDEYVENFFTYLHRRRK